MCIHVVQVQNRSRSVAVERELLITFSGKSFTPVCWPSFTSVCWPSSAAACREIAVDQQHSMLFMIPCLWRTRATFGIRHLKVYIYFYYTTIVDRDLKFVSRGSNTMSKNLICYYFGIFIQRKILKIWFYLYYQRIIRTDFQRFILLLLLSLWFHDCAMNKTLSVRLIIFCYYNTQSRKHKLHRVFTYFTK